MKRTLCPIFLLFILFAHKAFPAQDIGASMREYEENRLQEDLDKRLEAPRISPPAINADEAFSLPQGKTRMVVRKIIIRQAPSTDNKLPEEIARQITDKYRGKALSLNEMKALAGEIKKKTPDLRIKVYIPEQTFQDDILYINIIPER